jgi:hypothetical protein
VEAGSGVDGGLIPALGRHAREERLRITVRAERDDPHRPFAIIARGPLAPF